VPAIARCDRRAGRNGCNSDAAIGRPRFVVSLQSPLGLDDPKLADGRASGAVRRPFGDDSS
jgi:hypothetical protein